MSFQARPFEVGGPVRHRSAQQPRPVGAEASGRRDGRVSRRGELHRHPEARVAGDLLRLCPARLSAIVG